jgi:hypothetical protein
LHQIRDVEHDFGPARRKRVNVSYAACSVCFCLIARGE